MKEFFLWTYSVCLLCACFAPGEGSAAEGGGRWTGLLHNEDCTTFFDSQDFPAGKAGEITDRYVDVLAGAGVTVLAGGADIVYLFNYFQHGLPWSIPEYQHTLKAFSSLDEVCKLPRRHAVTYRDVVVPGEVYRAPLPASGREVSFDLPLGPKPPTDWQAEAVVEVAGQGTEQDAPAVAVNGVEGTLRRTEALQSGNRLHTYSIPTQALPGRNSDGIAITAAGTKPIKVLRVEARIAPSDGP